jgi:hypothetical protein
MSLFSKHPRTDALIRALLGDVRLEFHSSM